MKAHIDIKSAVMGGLLAAMVLLAAGAIRKASSGAIGRFQIGCTHENAYLLDTVTGQVWQSFEGGAFTSPKLTE